MYTAQLRTPLWTIGCDSSTTRLSSRLWCRTPALSLHRNIRGDLDTRCGGLYPLQVIAHAVAEHLAGVGRAFRQIAIRLCQGERRNGKGQTRR